MTVNGKVNMKQAKRKLSKAVETPELPAASGQPDNETESSSLDEDSKDKTKRRRNSAEDSGGAAAQIQIDYERKTREVWDNSDQLFMPISPSSNEALKGLRDTYLSGFKACAKENFSFPKDTSSSNKSSPFTRETDLSNSQDHLGSLIVKNAKCPPPLAILSDYDEHFQGKANSIIYDVAKSGGADEALWKKLQVAGFSQWYLAQDVFRRPKPFSSSRSRMDEDVDVELCHSFLDSSEVSEMFGSVLPGKDIPEQSKTPSQSSPRNEIRSPSILASSPSFMGSASRSSSSTINRPHNNKNLKLNNNESIRQQTASILPFLETDENDTDLNNNRKKSNEELTSSTVSKDSRKHRINNGKTAASHVKTSSATSAASSSDGAPSIVHTTVDRGIPPLQLGRRGRYYLDIIEEDLFLTRSKQRDTQLTPLLDWNLLFHSYSDNHDGYYRDWLLSQTPCRDSVPIKAAQKLAVSAVRCLAPPVPVALQHPASWGINARKPSSLSRDLTCRGVQSIYEVFHPACTSNSILLPPAAQTCGKYKPLTHESPTPSRKRAKPTTSATTDISHTNNSSGLITIDLDECEDFDELNIFAERITKQLDYVEADIFNNLRKFEILSDISTKLNPIRSKRKILHELLLEAYLGNHPSISNRFTFNFRPIRIMLPADDQVNETINSHDILCSSSITEQLQNDSHEFPGLDKSEVSAHHLQMAASKPKQEDSQFLLGACLMAHVPHGLYVHILSIGDFVQALDRECRWNIVQVERLKYDDSILRFIKVRVLDSSLFKTFWVAVEDGLIAPLDDFSSPSTLSSTAIADRLSVSQLKAVSNKRSVFRRAQNFVNNYDLEAALKSTRRNQSTAKLEEEDEDYEIEAGQESYVDWERANQPLTGNKKREIERFSSDSTFSRISVKKRRGSENGNQNISNQQTEAELNVDNPIPREVFRPPEFIPRPKSKPHNVQRSTAFHGQVVDTSAHTSTHATKTSTGPILVPSNSLSYSRQLHDFSNPLINRRIAGSSASTSWSLYNHERRATTNIVNSNIEKNGNQETYGQLPVTDPRLKQKQNATHASMEYGLDALMSTLAELNEYPMQSRSNGAAISSNQHFVTSEIEKASKHHMNSENNLDPRVTSLIKQQEEIHGTKNIYIPVLGVDSKGNCRVMYSSCGQSSNPGRPGPPATTSGSTDDGHHQNRSSGVTRFLPASRNQVLNRGAPGKISRGPNIAISNVNLNNDDAAASTGDREMYVEPKLQPQQGKVTSTAIGANGTFLYSNPFSPAYQQLPTIDPTSFAGTKRGYVNPYGDISYTSGRMTDGVWSGKSCDHAIQPQMNYHESPLASNKACHSGSVMLHPDSHTQAVSGDYRVETNYVYSVGTSSPDFQSYRICAGGSVKPIIGSNKSTSHTLDPN